MTELLDETVRVASLLDAQAKAAALFTTIEQQGVLAPGVLESAASNAIRDLATAVIQIEPATEQAGAFLVLGRLHRECPRVVFLTGWVSRSEGLRLLRQARSAAPESPGNAYFLAEALIDQNPREISEARSLLEWCAHLTPRPDYLVEDAHYVVEARELLARLGAAQPAAS